ncbi:hypothetical protein [Streptomyces sp. NPDC088727]|uniref:hypothetical protein n=1 Tax=Streptomyces sp. NPDC088727 TaxID=3365875 RepID=UPI003827B489
MPRSEIFAVRSALDMSDRQAHRLLAFAALDDITSYRRPRFQWGHPTLARQLGLDPHFLSLLQNYLHYRAAKEISNEKGIRPHKDNVAQLFRVEDNYPLDLIRMVASRKQEAQLAALLSLAVDRKVRVDGKVTVGIERILSRACGIPWQDLTSVYQRQRAAQQKELLGV